ncbi:hypothetical protein Hte_012147 [Hypoxylon texense]
MGIESFRAEKLRLTRPIIQNVSMGMILFCLPGIYLALTGLGAGGGQPSSTQVVSLTNAILYGVYTVGGWFGGTILNFLRPKWTIAIGGIGYPFYVGSLWYYDRIGNEAFPLFGGALLGFCAALLWTSSGFIQFAYAEEKDKAKWVLTSSGSTVGALIAFGINYDKQEATGVSTSVYVVFILSANAIPLRAICLDLLLIVDPRDVVRDDGRHIAIFKEPQFLDEMRGILAVLLDPKIIILIPAMFVGEMCLALTSSINAYYFNLRTRSLNNLLFQAIMIPAPIALSYIMDSRQIRSRRAKGLLGTFAVGAVTLGATAGLLAWIVLNDVDRSVVPSPSVDWTDAAFAAGFVLYLLFGAVFACFQVAVQWTLASLTNEPGLCARYAGAFKGTVGLGMCASFVVDARGVSYRDQTAAQLALYVLGLACLAYVVAVYVGDTNYFLEDAVIVPASVEEKLAAVEEVEAAAAVGSEEAVNNNSDNVSVAKRG